MTPLFAEIRRGERAFERLYRRHVADVYRYALVVLRDPDDAEAVTQTTFVNAYRAFKRGERPRNARAWLLALAHGICRQRARPDGDDDDDAARAVPDEGPPTPAEIRRALAHLPFNQRAALVMRELESRSYAEIAQVLELSATGVETLVFEARRALREQLEGSLSCHEAERAISRQIDGRLTRAERKPLREHLRGCAECAGFARSQRAQRPAWRVLASVPLPVSLQSFFGPGGVMANTIDRSASGAALGVAATALAVAALGVSGMGVLGQGLGSEARTAVAPAAERHLAPTTRRATPAGRATVAPVRPSGRAQTRPSRPVPRTAAPAAGRTTTTQKRAAARRPAAGGTATRSAAFPVRAPVTPKSRGHAQTAATPPSDQPPGQPAPPVARESTTIATPTPSVQLPVVPHLPPPPPLPLPPPPEPPKLP